VLQANGFVEPFESIIPGGFGAYVITCSKNMASVDADADRDFFMKTIYDMAKLFEPVADG